jgi:hypothetical protein
VPNRSKSLSSACSRLGASATGVQSKGICFLPLLAHCSLRACCRRHILTRSPAYKPAGQSFCTSMGATGGPLGAPGSGGATFAAAPATGAPERSSTYETTRLTPGI